MINYQLKSEVIASGLPLIAKKVSKSIYSQIVLEQTGEVLHHAYSYDEALAIQEHYKNTQPIEWQEALKINHAYFERVKTLKKHIKSMLDGGNCLFLTLTFSDKTLQKTTSDTRRQYVFRYLSSLNTSDYVANIDFGAKNGREHYHAVIPHKTNVDYKQWHKYGAIKGELIRNNANDYIKLSKYVSKLTNHAIKETTKRNAIIYKRNTKPKWQPKSHMSVMCDMILNNDLKPTNEKTVFA